MWAVESYQSGTVIVKSVTDPKLPHFYVYGKTGGSERERYEIAVDLATWINYPSRMPAWALDLKYHPDMQTCLITDSGISITAVGPMVLPENDNGACNWMQDISSEGRERIINNLIFNRKQTKSAYVTSPVENPFYVNE